jgi:hypothetical protein
VDTSSTNAYGKCDAVVTRNDQLSHEKPNPSMPDNELLSVASAPMRGPLGLDGLRPRSRNILLA